MRIALVILALTLSGVAFAQTPPPAERPGITVPADGFIRHSPSGLRLPREIPGPVYTHAAELSEISPEQVVLNYGPVTVTIARPVPAADPIALPFGYVEDPDAPSLPSLLFWGDGVQPVTISFLHAEGQPAKDWLSFTLVALDWQIMMSSQYAPADRDTIIRTAEAVWAMVASANEGAPR